VGDSQVDIHKQIRQEVMCMRRARVAWFTTVGVECLLAIFCTYVQ
jgi:hypothetical protein